MTADVPAGGNNDPGITIEANQAAGCFSIRRLHGAGDGDTGEDLIHFCDWPALKAAIDAFQISRGGPV